ncbi:MAG: threonylcarbamoyl-AMP synthase [Eubacterium sp.]|nr:threonylcarbamoyl-AMP synthase [Eubacterium sp.]
MQTQIISWDSTDGYKPDDLDQAVKILKNGGLVVFPTETVYGLGCNGRSEKAAKKVYKAKDRPGDNPLILHVADRDSVQKLVKEIPPLAEKLMDTFWPGPLTLIFRKAKQIPKAVTGGLETVAIRMPAHTGARDLIRAAGMPIAAPSANRSGRPSPTMVSHVIEDLDGRVDMIIDGGVVGIGYESTIVDVTGARPVILRPGFITKEMIGEVIGVSDDEIIQEASMVTGDTAPRAPGMKYRHYAPEAELTVVRGDEEEVPRKIDELARQFPSDMVGVLTTDERAGLYDYGVVLSIGSTRENTLGHELYHSLREFDHRGVKHIYAETFFGIDQEDALMNRLMKAAGGQIVDLADYHRLIFVCKENVTMSPMAEWIMKSIVMDKSVDICSRGLVVLFSEPINQKVMDVLFAHGVPCEELSSRLLMSEDLDENTLVITMSFTEKVKVLEEFGITEHVYTLREFVGLEDDVTDPYGGDAAAYEGLYLELKDLLYKMKKRLGWQ